MRLDLTEPELSNFIIEAVDLSYDMTEGQVMRELEARYGLSRYDAMVIARVARDLHLREVLRGEGKY